MAIKTDNKPDINTVPPQSQDLSRVKLSPQEIAEAIKAKRLSPQKQSYYFPGKGNIKYEPDIFSQTRNVLKLSHLDTLSGLDNETLVKRLDSAIQGLTIFQPIEEPAATMENVSPAPNEEEPSTMSDESPSNPLSPFSQLSSHSYPSEQTIGPLERPTKPEQGAGTETDKTQKPNISEHDNTKKLDGKNTTYSDSAPHDSPASTRLPDAPKVNQEPRVSSQSDTKIKQDVKTSQPTFGGANTSNTNKFNVEKPKLSPAPSPQGAFKSPEIKIKQALPQNELMSTKTGFKVGIPNTKSFSYPIRNGFRNAASSFGRFFKTNFGKFLTPGNVSRIGSSIIGGFAGMGIAGVPGAGAGALGGLVTPDLLKAGGGKIAGSIANSAINSGLNLSNRVAGIKTNITNIAGKAKNSNLLKRSLLGIVLAMFGFSIFGNLFSSPGEASPSTNQSSGSGSAIQLDYSIPFRDSSVSPLDVKNQIMATFPKSKIDYWDKIVQRSIAEGWNPAFVLTLWIEETGASHTTVTRNGGGGVPVAGNFTLGHLGCAPLEDQTIDQSLDCLFKNFNQYSNNQFAQFMARYSGGPAGAPFSNNPNFPGNIKHWYSILVPSGSGALKIVSTSNSSTRSSQVTTPSSCPVPNGTITCGSQMTPVNGSLGLCGHCGAGYTSPQELRNCQSYPENKYAIDIATKASETVFFPTINNHSISWRFVRQDDGSLGYIQIFAGEDTSTQEKYSLQIHHTEFGKGNRGTGKSGDYAASSCATCGAGHVHVQLRSDSTGQWLDAAQILCR